VMARALKPLLGKHHLAAFHRANSSRDHSWVEVQGVECYRQGPFVRDGAPIGGNVGGGGNW
jgi:tRNA pseudouridine38-40 synthase